MAGLAWASLEKASLACAQPFKPKQWAGDSAGLDSAALGVGRLDLTLDP